LIAVIREAALVFVLAVVLAGAGYMVRPADMPSTPDTTAAESGIEESGAALVVPMEDAHRHFKQGTALFADARLRDAYQSGHIPGAVNLDPNEFETWSADFFSKTSPNQLIITYCEGESCTLDLELAEKLAWMGYEKVFRLKNGWGQWKEHQLPVEQESE
jgi:rhodanese-related sulfurtransferase